MLSKTQDNLVVIVQSPITRRFVRAKAVQYLYAFQINQQANYQNALEAIKIVFIPDVFSKEPTDATQLEKEEANALALFAAWETGKAPYIPHAANKTPAYEVAAKLWEEYQAKVAHETNMLQGGFKATLDKIVDACLLILQLLVEWFAIAQNQAQKSNKQLSINIPYPIDLVHNHILEALYANDMLRNLMLQRHLSWNQHMDVVGRWYNQFIKEAPLSHGPLPTNTIEKDQQVLATILQQVVFKQEDIQNFFSNLDLGWEENEPITKKLLNKLDVESLLTTIKDSTYLAAGSADFYTELIKTALEQDRHLELLIQQHTPNWSIQRIILLDQIIIKLALCEMCYLRGTPTKVIINEYVDLAKKYSTLKSGAFVNGILDTIAKTVERPYIQM
jgi:N utilization substance protein B